MVGRAPVVWAVKQLAGIPSYNKAGPRIDAIDAEAARAAHEPIEGFVAHRHGQPMFYTLVHVYQYRYTSSLA